MIAASAVGAVLAGCVSVPEQMDKLVATQEPPSAAVRKVIVNAARDYLVDPYSIRDVEISSVVSDSVAGLQAVCVKFNSKNAAGGYVGRSAVSVRLKDGQPVSTAKEPPLCREPRLKYHPFPESDVLRKL